MLREKAALRLFCFLLGMTLVAHGQQTTDLLRLPAPTGAFSVGRGSFIWTDSSRGNRPVKVDVWYPSKATLQRSRRYYPDFDRLWNDDPSKRFVISHFGSSLRAMAAGRVRTNAQDDVEVSRAKAFPLLLFLPGLGALPFDYSIQLEEVASRGYIVAGVEPVDDSLAVVLPAGKVVPFDENLWVRYASPTSSAVIHFYEQRAVLWAKDLIFALDMLTRETQDKNSRWYRTIDLRHVGAFGHSHGGRSAATACLLDSRITACLNEDGRLDEGAVQRPYWPIAGKRMHGAFAMLDWFDPGLEPGDLAAMHTTLARYAGTRLMAQGAALDAYRTVSGGSYHLTLLLPGMQHTYFSDLPWITGNSDATRLEQLKYLIAIRASVVAFFDWSLRGRRTFLKNCGASPQGVLVQCYRQKPGRP